MQSKRVKTFQNEKKKNGKSNQRREMKISNFSAPKALLTWTLGSVPLFCHCIFFTSIFHTHFWIPPLAGLSSLHHPLALLPSHDQESSFILKRQNELLQTLLLFMSLINAVAIRTAPVRRLVFAIRTGVRRFHRISL